ncbi:hypothetical protein PC41400_01535 [Paenibacillus chitinolyticus]|uniref:Lipoprotein n=1 Tax=Paenibacillus chitinolyticus TaxID=79263 RepID=A0A410WPT5_9BACL|nr:hypothetical protein [Paenibacillus chitinolyticus]MCY9591015.1 hypothetical protein [Paenibacillus chitinolyticus]MCY9597184.1 hypothetical protein [Paenibacillus chitinolyticus]QAV16446.1 hypothetical protein PC41400_01535 [Paenibacillus chitinolyticus]
MKKKLTVIAITVGIIGCSLLTAGVAFGDVDPIKNLNNLKSAFESNKKKLNEMPNQTPEEIEATVRAGKEPKDLGKEVAKKEQIADPDGEAKFANQLKSYIAGMKDSVSELKHMAEETKDSKYLKKAEELEKKIARYEQEQQAYLKKEGKTVKELRKELDIPAY